MRNVAIVPALALLLAAPLFGQSAQHQGGWRQNAVCYEVFVRSFYDSDGDGVGDLRGLTQKLDYINDGRSDAAESTHRDLGATCIWLMPIAQSPSYHGYDVTNYYQVNRHYGTNEDFKDFMREAHKRGIKVLVDLVLNHTSNEHPFFRSALLDSASAYRDWYMWSPTQRKMQGWEAPTWHKAPNRNEWYYGLFWSGMPDLNLANPAVTAEWENVARFWLTEMNVDGFRLDAVAHFFEDGDKWKDAPGVFPWLRDYSAAIRKIKPDAFTVGEVYDSLGSVLKYFPDGLDTFFAFEIADEVFGALRSGSGSRLVAAVNRAQREIPDHRWGMFLRNHDQTRTLTELQGDVARNKLAATLMLTLPGLPFVYYGEELGMTGAKSSGDIRLRTPMHWSLTKAAGFTNVTPWEPLAADSFTANVAVEDADPKSLLNLHRKLIHWRSAHASLGSGEFVPLIANAPGVLAYLRRSGRESALIISNLTDKRVTSVPLTSDAGVMPPARYQVNTLLGDLVPGTLNVSGNGKLNRTVRVLEPYETQILLLTR